MTGEYKTPWSGMVLAVLTITGLVLAGVSLALVATTALVWLLSLWVEWLRPKPITEIRTPAARIKPDTIARAAMAATIEGLGRPLVLLDGHRIIAANAAARETLGAHITGQDARIALRHPDAVRLLAMGDGGSVTIRGLTGTGSLWQLTRQRIDERYWSIELCNRTAEADMGRAHTDFVANASHELRTPLSSIIGYVETLAEDPLRVDAETTSRFQATVCARRGGCKTWCRTSCRFRNWKRKSTICQPTMSILANWRRGWSVNLPPHKPPGWFLPDPNPRLA